MELEEYMLESVAVELESIKEEIVGNLVLKQLSEGKSVNAEYFEYVNALVESSVIEMSESILPSADELELTEDDYVITESGEVYFTDGVDLEYVCEATEFAEEVAEDITFTEAEIAELEEAGHDVSDLQLTESTEEVAEDITFTEAEIAELEEAGYDVADLQLTESTEPVLEGTDAIVASVISKL